MRPRLHHHACSIWVLFLTGLALDYCAGVVNGDADFASVRVLMTHDSSGKKGDPKGKYWRK